MNHLYLTVMDHFELDKDFQINYHQEDNYYHQYCRLYLANIALTSQVKQLIGEKQQLINRLNKYEDEEFFSSSERNHSQKNKRIRRNADEIERYYKCAAKICGKSYGSEGSLNQHYKLKHPEIYISVMNAQIANGVIKEEQKQKVLLKSDKDKENKRRLVN